MTVFEARVASMNRYILAEGPVWSASTNAVLWVDIERGQVFVGELDEDWVTEVRSVQFAGRVGVAVPGPNGSLLVAEEHRLTKVESDGKLSAGPLVVEDSDSSRTNDGACDPQGRFLIGTMAYDGLGGHDRLSRVEDDGSLLTLDADLGISNGVAWSPEGAIMYNADTLRGVVWARDYDSVSGEVGPRREHLRVEGYPDGICVDRVGNIWVAVWGAGEVRCYSSDGAVRDVVAVSAPHVSSVAFVGQDLERLLITTASRDLDERGLAQYPDAGRLFLVDVGVAGAPTYEWSGSWGTAVPDSRISS